MYEDWPETTKVLSAQLRNLRGGAPDVMKAFSGIAQTALAPKALDAKTKTDCARHRHCNPARSLASFCINCTSNLIR
jgi:hypothetical protein